MDQVNLTFASIANLSGPPPLLSFDSNGVVPAVLLLLCVLVGVPGNLAVIILKPNWQNLSLLTQSLMMNLALSDLLSLGMQFFWIYNMLFNWTLGTATCKIVGFLTYCSVFGSILTVTAVSIQRYMQVIHKQRCLQFKRRVFVLLWSSAMAISIPALVFEQADTTLQKGYQKTTCRQIYTSSAERVAVLVTESFAGFSLLIVNIFLYIFINKKLKQATFFNNASTSRLINSIIAAVILLWLPYLVFDLVSICGILNGDSRIIKFYHVGMNVFAAVLLINSCINPLLYAFALGVCRKDTNLNSNSGEHTSDGVI